MCYGNSISYTVPCIFSIFLGKMAMQYTVAIIKPHAVVNRLKILQLLKNFGFRLIGQRFVEINIDEAWYLCKDEAGKVAAESRQTEAKIQSLLGTAMILLLTHERVFALMNEVLGPEDPVEARKTHPKSLRARFGDVAPYDVIAASESPSMAIKNIQHFFPRYSDILNGPMSDISQERVQIDTFFREKMLPTLLDAFYDVCVIKPVDPVIHLSKFLLNNNSNHPKIIRPGNDHPQTPIFIPRDSHPKTVRAGDVKKNLSLETTTFRNEFN